jgi:predicted HTH domain antitoxin
MKKPAKTKQARPTKRDLFSELSEGMKALAEARLGKRKLGMRALTATDKLALATALYKSESLSIGRAAKVAGMPLEAFMVEMGRAGIAVIRGNARTLQEDLKNIKARRAR